MLRRCRQVGCLIILSLIPCLSAAVTPYKWTDSQGRVHYGDRPPPDQAVEPVKVQPTHTATPAPPNEQEASAPAADRPQQQDPAAESETAANKKLMQENCQIAQRNLKILSSSGRRVHAMGTDGKPYVLDDKERELQLNEARQHIEQFCQ